MFGGESFASAPFAALENTSVDGNASVSGTDATSTTGTVSVVQPPGSVKLSPAIDHITALKATDHVTTINVPVPHDTFFSSPTQHSVTVSAVKRPDFPEVFTEQFAIAGNIDLLFHSVVAPTPASFTTTGQTVIGNISIPITPLSMDVTMQSAALRADSVVIVTPAVLTETAQSIALRATSVLPVAVDAIPLTMGEIDIVATLDYTITGQIVTLFADSVVAPTSEDFTYTGQEVGGSIVHPVSGTDASTATGTVTASAPAPVPTIIYAYSGIQASENLTGTSFNAMTYSSTSGPRSGPAWTAQSTSAFHLLGVNNFYTDSEIGVCGWFHLGGNSSPGGTYRLMEIRNPSATRRITLSITSSRTLEIGVYTNTSTYAILGTGSTVVPASTWFHLDFRGKFSASVGEGTVYYNGVSELALTSQDTLQGGSGTTVTLVAIEALLISSTSSSLSGVKFADIVLYNPTGITSPNNKLGVVNVDGMAANGTGTYNDSTPAGTGAQATRYLNVNELFGVDARRNDLSQGQKDTYLINAPNAITDGNILALLPYALSRSQVDTDSTRKARALVRSAGGTLTQGTQFSPNAFGSFENLTIPSTTCLRWVLQTDPETGAAWTSTRLQTTEIGYLADVTTDVFQLHACGADVVYRPADGTADAFIIVNGREPVTTIPTTAQIVKRISAPISGTDASTATGTVTASG